MNRPGIPQYTGPDPELARALEAIKQNVELIGGARGTPISAVATTATLAQVITALNLVINRLSST